MVAMTVFDGGFDLLLKPHRIFQMMDVAGLITAGIAFVNRRTVTQKRIGLHAPGLVEIVLAAGAMQFGRPFVSIHPDHIITLTPPGALEIRHADVASKVMALALGIEDNVVVLPGQLLRINDIRFRRVDADLVTPAPERIFTAEFGMKITGVLGQRIVIRLIVDIEILAVHLRTFVDEFHQRPFTERHSDIRIQSAALVELVVAVGRGGKQKRLVGVDDAMPETEKIAQRAENAGRRCIVPCDFEQAISVIVVLCHPDVCNTAGPLDIRQYSGFARLDTPCVCIASGGVPG